ncbi:MAG: hypothetical protein WBO29_12215 [Albidovulum sp.]
MTAQTCRCHLRCQQSLEEMIKRLQDKEAEAWRAMWPDLASGEDTNGKTTRRTFDRSS